MGGDWVLVGWLMLDVTQTSAWVGTAFAVYYLPMVLLGVPAGSIADRFDRRGLIRTLELLSAVALAMFAGLFASQGVAFAQVLSLTLVLGGLRAFAQPVRLSLAYDVVGAAQVTRGLAGVSLGVRIGILIGALIVGGLTHHFSVAYALAVMAVCHLVAFSCLRGRFTGSVHRSPDPTPIWRNLKDYVYEIRFNRVLLVLTVVTALIEVFGTSYATVLPEIADRRLALGAQGLGWMNAAQAAGGLVVGLLLFALPQRRTNTIKYAASIVGLGLSIVALGYAPDLVFILVALGAVSGMVTAWDIYTQSMVQLCVPDHLRGRAMGAWVFAIGSAPLGHLEIGFLAATAGAEIALYGNGVGVVTVIGLAFLTNKSLRRL